MANLIGQKLGQYEITSLLGKGGMATVYRARQTSMDRDVAIKVIKPDLAETADFVTRFRREAKTIASLSHANILKVFDYGQHGDLVYLVMELLSGGSLAELIRKGPLPLDRVSKFRVFRILRENTSIRVAPNALTPAYAVNRIWRGHTSSA
jgi:serine/threonine protein kinase